MKRRMPALFAGHGSPMNVMTDNPYRRAWMAFATSLEKPLAILCMSAHWETDGIRVSGGESRATLHEFHGYPPALYDVQYPAPGSDALCRRVTQLLAPHPVIVDRMQGLDHGAWTVLAAMFPEAGIPVVQLSLDRSMSPASHYELATQLRPLRDEGVLIVGSGNIVHNLALFDWTATSPPDWAWRFNEHVKRMLVDDDREGLCDWGRLGEDAALAVPTPEHYLPLLYVAAQRADGESIRFIADHVISSVSMTCAIVGDEHATI